MSAKTKPIKKEEEVQQNSDAKIDQDYPGFPYFPADKKSISPVTVTEKNWLVLKKGNQKKFTAVSSCW